MGKRNALIAFIAIIAVATIIITICSSNSGEIADKTNDKIQNDTKNFQKSDYDIPDWFELPNISINSGRLGGTKADTGTTSYLFRGRTMEEYINYVDAQYAYAKQWLGFEDAAPISTRIQFDRGGNSFTSGIEGAEYICLPGFNLLAPVHEAVHYLLAVNKINVDFIWLLEGFPEAIGFIYGDENPNSYYAKGIYYNLTRKDDYNSKFDFKHHAHVMALDAVNYFIENDTYGSYLLNGAQLGIKPDDKPSDFPQGYLNTYQTAASFVIYMLEIGSKEDFMQLFTDIEAAKEVYGKDFNALYEQWLEFLSDN